MNVLYGLLEFILRPFASALFLPVVLLLVSGMAERGRSGRERGWAVAALVPVFHVVYDLARFSPAAALWLARLENPFLAALAVLALPALLLRDGGWRSFLVVLSIAGIALAGLDVAVQYGQAPPGRFAWLPLRPLSLAVAWVGLLVLVGRCLSLNAFRRVVRLASLVLLLYGGFLFRQNWADFSQTIERRPRGRAELMAITETVPVLRDDNRLTYLPSAPCRFSADGGYVQGCNMELGQRAMQLDFSKVAAGNPGETALTAKILAACAALAALCFLAGRWWCGWVCPLATLGDGLDLVRRALGLPHVKPSRPLKLAYLISGISTASVGLLLARAWPSLNANGTFLGCKIPLYPFCKICPGQQVCPLVSRGPAGVAPLPGPEWLFGFFRYGLIALLLVYGLAFLTARRLWCRFCPMGMLGGLFNGGALVGLKKNPGRCNGCGACNEVCPMDIHRVQVERVRRDVTDYHCVLCLKCVAACPQDGCLSFELAGQKVCASEFK